MSKETSRSLSLRLTSGDLDALRDVVIQISELKSLNLLDLLSAWKYHVAKLEDDTSLQSSDRSAWGAYDLIAALILRDSVEIGMSSLQKNIRQRIQGVLNEIDNRFISYTERDEFNRTAV